MSKFLLKPLILLCFIFSGLAVKSQDARRTGNNGLPTYTVGIFAPLYLDSVFSNNTYRYGKQFPRFVMAGLDFVLGAQIALDSMKPANANVKAIIFDSKGSMDIPSLIAAHKMDSLQLIIGAVKDEEVQQLAGFALQKKIPFVSAVFPNNAGVMENPYLLMLNSTLLSHCEAIYRHVQKVNPNDNILFVRKPGGQEDRIQQYFQLLALANGKPALKMKTVTLLDDFTSLASYLDSTRNNVIIGGSLQESFAAKLTKEASSLNASTPIKLIGMPNWDGFTSLTRKGVATDYPIYYTTPFFNYKWDNYSKIVQKAYTNTYKGNPSDMSYKGFEAVYRFTQLLARHPDDFLGHVNDNNIKVFSEYNFKPVYASAQSTVPDYMENKQMYFIKIVNGRHTKAW